MKVTFPLFCLLFPFLLCGFSIQLNAQTSLMMFGDTARLHRPFSKDPHVIRFKDRYLMYYSVPGIPETGKGWGIAVAESKNLINWNRVGEINNDPNAVYESKGFAAPCALVQRDTVHLFYQTYGNGKKDAICHAWSVDGLTFTRNSTNPVFSPDGDWNCGRAIDAEVCFYNNNFYLFFATRDPAYKIQLQGVAVAPAGTRFNREDWIHVSKDGPILKPELPWEGECVEGASVIKRNGKLYMFYAGAYNNWPQQIGIATSEDAIHWNRISDQPFLPNGKRGEWNSSESGHPHIFDDGKRSFLFYQGNNDNGKTWFISNAEVVWTTKGPYIKN